MRRLTTVSTKRIDKKSPLFFVAPLICKCDPPDLVPALPIHENVEKCIIEDVELITVFKRW